MKSSQRGQLLESQAGGDFCDRPPTAHPDRATLLPLRHPARWIGLLESRPAIALSPLGWLRFYLLCRAPS
ncbi:MAG: hypothetical protein EA001_05125 [Oscillatoriales cyanobacterium]|nr:MAG: hypothetical protein EA001_05125 [Oscillatoriales cyanobacterium]